ncbi:hypothetical protein TNCV_4103651 [Trichonephila clavipes]|nr:hypothetical protein TNCV_4103651 [Trichonephila clavipes]
MSGYREIYKKIKESSSQSLITDYIVRKGRATQNENEVCENPWPLPQISIAETVPSDDEGDLEPLRKRTNSDLDKAIFLDLQQGRSYHRISRVNVAAVAERYWYRNVACFVMGSSPVPPKTRRVGQRCTLNLSRAETFSRWDGQGPPTSLPLPATSRENLRLDGYLKKPHSVKAPYIYKHPCLLRGSNPVPTPSQSTIPRMGYKSTYFQVETSPPIWVLLSYIALALP